MTMFTEPDGSVSISEGLAPISVGGGWSTSGSDLSVQEKVPLSDLDSRLLLPECVEGEGFDTTPHTNDNRYSNSGYSSSAFNSDGLVRTTLQAYFARISVLRNFAAQDGYALNHASEFDFWKFIVLEPQWRKGNLVLMDNGNLRAIWKDSQETHLGLQFLGGEMVQFVLFKQREAIRPVSRISGRDTLAGLRRQIDAFELDSLLCE